MDIFLSGLKELLTIYTGGPVLSLRDLCAIEAKNKQQ